MLKKSPTRERERFVIQRVTKRHTMFCNREIVRKKEIESERERVNQIKSKSLITKMMLSTQKSPSNHPIMSKKISKLFSKKNRSNKDGGSFQKLFFRQFVKKRKKKVI